MDKVDIDTVITQLKGIESHKRQRALNAVHRLLAGFESSDKDLAKEIQTGLEDLEKGNYTVISTDDEHKRFFEEIKQKAMLSVQSK